MRVAAVCDIHANLPALEAVLEEIRHEAVDCIVIGGDVVPGPMPRQTLERLLDPALPARFLFGNGETAVLESMAGREPAAVPSAYRPMIHWTARQLRAEDGATMRAWPATVRLEIPALGRVLFCHATPRDDNEIFTRLTPEERLLPIFDDAAADLVVCGHTHMQFDRRIGRTRVVNAGSAGMPFGAPGADWLLLGPDVQFRHTSYDLESAAARIRATDYPQAEDFAAHSVLAPPAEQQMLELYSR